MGVSVCMHAVVKVFWCWGCEKVITSSEGQVVSSEVWNSEPRSFTVFSFCSFPLRFFSPSFWG